MVNISSKNMFECDPWIFIRKCVFVTKQKGKISFSRIECRMTNDWRMLCKRLHIQSFTLCVCVGYQNVTDVRIIIITYYKLCLWMLSKRMQSFTLTMAYPFELYTYVLHMPMSMAQPQPSNKRRGAKSVSVLRISVETKSAPICIGVSVRIAQRLCWYV